MATATKKARAGTKVTADAMQFLMDEDNGGEYHWTLIGSDRETLARSPGFGSYEDAERSARVVLSGAGSARLEAQAGGRLPR